MAEEKLYNVYPNPLASNEVKDSEKYGIEYGNFIVHEWLYGNDNSRYIKRKELFSYYESLRRNDVDVSKFKDILGINQDKAWTALDWTFVPIIPKFVDTIVDGFAVELFKIQAKGVDVASQKERFMYKRNLETKMLSKDLMAKFSQDVGIDVNPKGDIPDTSEELELHMELKYQTNKEIATEICVNKTLELNFWKETFNNIIQDITTFGVGATRNEVDQDKGIVQKRVDPKHLIYSFDQDETRDKRGCYYFAEVKILTVEEVKRQSNSKFSDEQLKKMASHYTGRFGNAAAVKEDNYADFNVEVIKFCFKTTRNEVYKKKYKGNIVEKEDTWQLHPDSKSKRIDGVFDVWYEGNLIPFADMIYGYKLMKHMVRPMSNINISHAPYCVYELNTPSMVARMEKFANEIQITVLKLQQLIATAKPQGAMIDIAALNDLNIGTGGLLEPIDAVDLYNQKGDLLWSSRNYEGDRNVAPPIQLLPNGIGQDLSQLINYYNQNVQMLYDVTGLNRVRDGSSPQAGALVGTQKIALAMSNNATKHIMNGALNILKNTAEIIVSRIQQMRLYGEELNKAIKGELGEKNVEVLQEANNLHLYEMSISIVVDMDEEERMDFNRLIEVALNNGILEIPDVIDLKATKNLKLANEYLKIKIKRRKREMQQMREREILLQSQSQAQAQIAVKNAEAQAAQTQMQADANKIQLETRVKAMLQAKDQEFQIMMENLKFQHEMQLKGLEVQANKELNKFKEDSKDKRTAIQATQQSKMVEQRNNQSPSIDFESQAELKAAMQASAPQELNPQIAPAPEGGTPENPERAMGTAELGM